MSDPLLSEQQNTITALKIVLEKTWKIVTAESNNIIQSRNQLKQTYVWHNWGKGKGAFANFLSMAKLFSPSSIKIPTNMTPSAIILTNALKDTDPIMRRNSAHLIRRVFRLRPIGLDYSFHSPYLPPPKYNCGFAVVAATGTTVLYPRP